MPLCRVPLRCASTPDLVTWAIGLPQGLHQSCSSRTSRWQSGNALSRVVALIVQCFAPAPPKPGPRTRFAGGKSSSWLDWDCSSSAMKKKTRKSRRKLRVTRMVRLRWSLGTLPAWGAWRVRGAKEAGVKKRVSGESLAENMNGEGEGRWGCHQP